MTQRGWAENAADVEVSPALDAELMRWAEEGNGQLPLDAAQPSPDPTWLADWIARGIELAAQVQRDLGSEAEVAFEAWSRPT